MQKFYKYQGTGNDFVMIDNRDGSFEASQQRVGSLCDRRFGIGADGLILIENAEGFDFKMVYFNADGNEGSMCGNGGRCAVKFASDLNIFDNKTLFIAVDGPHQASIENGLIHLRMMDVNGVEVTPEYDFLNTGSPHYIQFVEDVRNLNVKEEGSRIRYADEWVKRGGTNVNFVEPVDDGLIVRTYERGVEDETFSCGTGVTAAALDAHVKYGHSSPVSITTLGGSLKVSFKPTGIHSFSDIFLIGPAEKVFEGEI